MATVARALIPSECGDATIYTVGRARWYFVNICMFQLLFSFLVWKQIAQQWCPLSAWMSWPSGTGPWLPKKWSPSWTTLATETDHQHNNWDWPSPQQLRLTITTATETDHHYINWDWPSPQQLRVTITTATETDHHHSNKDWPSLQQLRLTITTSTETDHHHSHWDWPSPQ